MTCSRFAEVVKMSTLGRDTSSLQNEDMRINSALSK